MRPSLLLALLLLPLAGCRTPTDITLELRTDIPCSMIKGTTISVGTPGSVETKAPAATVTSCQDGRLGALVVVPSESKSGEVGVRIVTGIDRAPEECDAAGFKGCVVARRALHFIPHDELRLPIDLRSSCIGVPCDPASTCVQSQCVASAVPPDRCSGNGCDESMLLPASTGPSPLAHPVVAAGGQHTCVLRRDHTVVCVGSDVAGQMGRGAITESPASPAPAMLGVHGITDILAGYHVTCVLDGSGVALCAGENRAGDLGDGDLTSPVPTPTPVVGIVRPRKLAISRTDAQGADSERSAHGCAIDEGGVLRCWGNNSYGQVDGSGVLAVSSPVAVALDGVTDVTTGDLHTCAVAGGKVFCWGCQVSGVFGCSPVDVGQTSVSTPTPIGDIADAVEVAAGTYHTCVLRQGGAVACFGRNETGQLGTGEGKGLGVVEPLPKDVVGLTDAQHLSSGYSGTCALRVGGAVSCWGRNSDGQCGDGALDDDHTTPIDVALPAAAGQVAVGFDHACAVLLDDRIFCWGRDTSGETTGALADGGTAHYPMPVEFHF